MSGDQESNDGDLLCSFCGKTQDEVCKLIAGPTVFICDECVDLCNDIIEEDARAPRKEEQPTVRPNPFGIHHVDLTVSDLARSTEFYDRVLPFFGFWRGPDSDGNPVWAAAFGGEIGLQPARSDSAQTHDRYSPGLHHLAFAAPSQHAVNQVFTELERLGVPILDPPATYDQYAPGYYAVFFTDPDGMKLEYVYTPKPL